MRLLNNYITRTYMKKIFNNSKNKKILFEDLQLLQSAFLQDFNVVSYNIEENKDNITFGLSKPKFLKLSDKIYSKNFNFNNHYCNASGPFLLGSIKNQTLEGVPGYIITTHTSFAENKYKKKVIKK